MSDRGKWVRLLDSTGALQSGHFVLSSGRHSPRYVQCARVLERPSVAEAIGAALAARLPQGIDRIVSPPLGALLIGYEVARALGVRFMFPERGRTGTLDLRRSFTVEPGERVAIVEDVITTGRTTGELVDLLNRLDAEVVAVAAIVDRSSVPDVCGHAIESLLRMSIPTYEASECPQCALGTPITRPGSRSPEQAA